MSIRIGHSSIDEHGKAAGGTAGDQTAKELCIRPWYNKPWGLVLRCKDSAKAEKMAQTCEAGCNNAHIGYDQNQRNTLSTQAAKVGYNLGKIATNCECDCSSFMAVCAQAAGINVPYSSGNAPTTSTMKSAFTSTGLFTVLTGGQYTGSDKYLRRGDILVSPGHHTAMALDNGGSAGSTPAPAATHITNAGYKAKITAKSGLNRRVSPDPNSAKVDALPYGTIVTVTKDAGNGWGEINNHGWSDLRYVSKVSASAPAPAQASGGYKVGGTYTIQTEIKVRTGPGTNYAAKSHGQLTGNAQAHDSDRDGALNAGTRVTCQEIRNVGGDTWMRIPSGWIAAKYSGHTYVK